MDESALSLVRRYARIVDQYVNDVIVGEPEELYKASLHIFKAGGKRLRPAITMATARMLGGIEAEARALPLAASIEVSHTFTLIHDDIMDKDEFRRGVPTVHKLWGEDWAILAGDLLHAYSYLLMVKGREKGLSEEDIYRAVKVLSEASIKITHGQAFDLMFEARWDIGVHDYLKMVSLKTGVLIEASARLGAIASKSSVEVEEMMGQYGRMIGVAFQIRDDILGLFGDPLKTGKPIYGDLRRGKKTLLTIHAVQETRGDDREFLLRVMKGGERGEEELKRAAQIIKESGAVETAESLAREYIARAKEILSAIRCADELGKRVLESIADYVIERDN